MDPARFKSELGNNEVIGDPEKTERNVCLPYCPECGGKLNWDRILKQYACQSCGTTFDEAQLETANDKKYERTLTDDDKKQQRHDDYLNWWLSDKDKKKK